MNLLRLPLEAPTDYAVLLPGNSETSEFVEPLGNKLVEQHGFQDVDVILLGDALAKPHKYAKRLNRRPVYTHSAGPLALRELLKAGAFAGPVVALSPAEPTPLLKTAQGVIKVSRQGIKGAEEGVEQVPLYVAGREMLRHPIETLKLPFSLRNFSTARFLIEASGQIAFGSQYYAFDNDEFGFHRPDAINLLNSMGIPAHTLQGTHNYPMTNPLDTLRQIDQALGIYPS
jgi:hypothetical protein